MNVVLTGDNTNITPYIVIMVIAIVVIAGVLIYRIHCSGRSEQWIDQ